MRNVALVLLIFLLGGLTGCTTLRPRVETVADKAIQQIDAAIGKEDVLRRKVIDAIADAKAEVERLQRIEAESTVDAEMMTEKLTAMRQNKAEAAQGLLQLADLIEARQPVTLTNGSVMTVAELEQYAEKKKAEFETQNKKITLYEESLALSQQTATDAHQRWVDGKRTIETLQAQVELIDARIAALRAARPASTLAEVSSTYEDVIRQSQATVDEVDQELEKEIRVIQELRQVQKPQSANEEQLAQDLQSSGDLASELRDLAGK